MFAIKGELSHERFVAFGNTVLIIISLMKRSSVWVGITIACVDVDD